MMKNLIGLPTLIVITLTLVVGVFEVRENNQQRKLSNVILLMDQLNPVASVQDVTRGINNGRPSISLNLRNETVQILRIAGSTPLIKYCTSNEELWSSESRFIATLFPLSADVVKMWVSADELLEFPSFDGVMRVDFKFVLDGYDTELLYNSFVDELRGDSLKILRLAAKRKNAFTFPSYYEFKEGVLTVREGTPC